MVGFNQNMPNQRQEIDNISNSLNLLESRNNNYILSLNRLIQKECRESLSLRALQLLRNLKDLNALISLLRNRILPVKEGDKETPTDRNVLSPKQLHSLQNEFNYFLNWSQFTYVDYHKFQHSLKQFQ